jgi:hypothetical protein
VAVTIETSPAAFTGCGMDVMSSVNLQEAGNRFLSAFYCTFEPDFRPPTEPGDLGSKQSANYHGLSTM